VTGKDQRLQQLGSRAYLEAMASGGERQP
jgi:hypothetical protein